MGHSKVTPVHHGNILVNQSTIMNLFIFCLLCFAYPVIHINSNPVPILFWDGAVEVDAGFLNSSFYEHNQITAINLYDL